jgi:hydrogenase maturation protease
MGSVLLGDDGFGPLVVETFRCEYDCGPDVELIDLGTPGLDLAPYLYGRDLVLLIDAVQSNHPPGTLSIYGEADFASSPNADQCVQLRITGHDPGLWESLTHLRLAGCAPIELLVVGVVPLSSCFGEPISPAVLGSLRGAFRTIVQVLAEHGIHCSHRCPPLEMNLWWIPRGLTAMHKGMDCSDQT